MTFIIVLKLIDCILNLFTAVMFVLYRYFNNKIQNIARDRSYQH